MTCGIYLGTPKNVILDKVYIGQALNIEDRINRHNKAFIDNKHCKKMQNAYNIYGEFSWEIIQECDSILLNELETYYIKLFNASTAGFNTYTDYRDAPVLRGIDNGMAKEDRLEVYLAIINNSLKYPDEERKQIAIRSNAKIDEVKSLWDGKAYHWLEEIVPEEYIQVMNLRGTRQTGGRSAKQQGINYPTLLSPNLKEYLVDNVRSFAKEHKLDHSDLSNVLNLKVASVGGWIVKNLNLLNPELHNKFNSSNRGHYKKQFNKFNS